MPRATMATTSAQPEKISQETAGPPQGFLTPAGGGLGAARPWGRSQDGLLPLVAVTTDLRQQGELARLLVHGKYVEPVHSVSRCAPVLLPSLGMSSLLGSWLDALDGLVLTGSPSNVEPHHYGEPLADPDSPRDAARDATTLPLIRLALARGMPILGICRGFQEINVALGGTLHQKVHEEPGFMDHREDLQAPLDVQYGPAHEVCAVSGGRLARLIGQDRWMVNSLHGQGVRRLAPDLLPEALAPDGLVEAFTHRDAKGFLVAVQWHPEWRAGEDPVSRALYESFGRACRAYRQARRLDPAAALVMPHESGMSR